MTNDTFVRERARLYLVTPPTISDIPAFAATLETVLAAGDVASLQLRLKQGDTLDVEATRAVAAAALPLLREVDVALIINDSPELAAELGADGVHLGAADMDVKSARALVGEEMVIGATCKSSRHLAMQAGEAGADYVAFGSFYPTTTKADATPADPSVLEFWQEIMELPCVAIGGMTADNAEPIVRAGADFIAVSAGVWNDPEGPAEAVRAFNALFDRLHDEWKAEAAN